MLSFVDIVAVSHVADDLWRFVEALSVHVGDLEAKLVLHGHDDFNVVKRIQPQVVDEVGVQLQLGEKDCLVYSLIAGYDDFIIFCFNSSVNEQWRVTD